MPTYEYKCPKCGHQFEVFQRITSKGGARCPECGTKAERQLSGGAGFVFKGSGFYLTDYGRAGQKEKQKSSEAGEPSSSGEKKPDSGEKKPDKEKSGGGTPPAPKFKPTKKDDS
jgi:putative FmdB family regulatory protein